MPEKLNVSELAQLETIGFWSTEKIHPLVMNENGETIREVGNGVGLIIRGEPGKFLNIDMAILSPAGASLANIIDTKFNVQMFAKHVSNANLQCLIGTLIKTDDKWLINNAVPVTP